jgi:glyoxylase-like metal-dependent hydrolase (beta-lactamase superfamily II)
MLGKPLKNLSILQAAHYKSPEADVLLEDGSVVECGSMKFEVLHTPGHTPGGICLILRSADQACIFSGDTLFAGGVGRTDFPGGDWDQLLRSIKTRLLKYPDETIVLPGHGPQTTVGDERKFNPFLTQ